MPRKGTMKDYTIPSRYLDEKMTLKVYYPEAFSPLYKYHLCIMQDGDDYFQLGRVATLSDTLQDSEAIMNTVFIGIHYRDKFDRREKYHPDGKQNKAYTQFLVQEAVPFLDDLLPSYHMGQSRTLMGDSLAGTLALMTALRYPNTFGNVIMQSPLVNESVQNAVENTNDIHLLDIYHTIGLEETIVHTTDGSKEDFLTPNRKLHQLLAGKGSSYVYHELNGPHTWKPWQKDLKRALTTMFTE
ncbi:alpha/beta hydrolase-fold protein [Lentibacillus sp. N15]|uniref:alpha/beta hydrolase n=1 Tax=Lentibacillus songyuanensis TaxID=3136161 RepID=UPI0031BAB68A